MERRWVGMEAAGREGGSRKEREGRKGSFLGESFWREGYFEGSFRRFVDAAFVPVGVQAHQEAKDAKVLEGGFFGRNSHGLNGWDGWERIFFWGRRREFHAEARRARRGREFGLTGWVRMGRDG